MNKTNVLRRTPVAQAISLILGTTLLAPAMAQDAASAPEDVGEVVVTEPEITQVALRPEEAVLGACKASSGSGGSGPGGGNCRTPVPCSSLGS